MGTEEKSQTRFIYMTRGAATSTAPNNPYTIGYKPKGAATSTAPAASEALVSAEYRFDPALYPTVVVESPTPRSQPSLQLPPAHLLPPSIPSPPSLTLPSSLPLPPPHLLPPSLPSPPPEYTKPKQKSKINPRVNGPDGIRRHETTFFKKGGKRQSRRKSRRQFRRTKPPKRKTRRH